MRFDPRTAAFRTRQPASAVRSRADWEALAFAAPDVVLEAPETRAGVAVVIPAYRVTDHIGDVLRRIGPEVDRIYVVDDCCPDGSGDAVEALTSDPRVSVVRNA